MLTPLRLRPVLRRRPWGGRSLDAMWSSGGADRDPGSGPFGEAWLAGPDNRVADGPDAGRSVAEMVAEHGAGLLGSDATAFALRAKLLDAAEPLSVQVHPDDAYARERGEASGKTEAWWVLNASPDAFVWWGFGRATGPAEVAAAARAGTLASLLRRLPVGIGDVVVNPAGTVHALGPGLVVYEVQQSADVTYRMDDHGRLGDDGRPRELHLDDALAVARWTPGEAPAPAAVARGPGRTELARTPAFVLEAVVAGGGPSWEVRGSACELLTHLGEGGDVALAWSSGALPLRPWDTLLLPAGLGPVRVDGGPARLARAWAEG